jgi:hypothetical protein
MKSTVRPPPREHGISPHPAGEFLASPTSTESHVSSQTKTGPWNYLMNAWPADATDQPLNTETFIREEMADFVESGFYAVLPYPQCDTCLTPAFPWGSGGARQACPVGSGPHLVPYQPTHLEWTTKEAMQFGGASTASCEDLPRRPCRARVPGKYDIKDGFYHDDQRHFALASPSSSPNMREEQMVAVPRPHHGWINSLNFLQHVGDGV